MNSSFLTIYSVDLFGNCKKCYTIFMETVYDKAQKLNSKNFKLLIGVKKETFQLMLEHLNSAYQIQHRKGGRPRSLPMEDQLHYDPPLLAILSHSASAGL
ncbi:transposase-like protein, IS1515 [Streptococcus pneumoniae]|nr:transposase-like protein, IS1515 [Streptococcus pneumoniae]